MLGVGDDRGCGLENGERAVRCRGAPRSGWVNDDSPYICPPAAFNPLCPARALHRVLWQLQFYGVVELNVYYTMFLFKIDFGYFRFPVFTLNQQSICSFFYGVVIKPVKISASISRS